MRCKQVGGRIVDYCTFSREQRDASDFSLLPCAGLTRGTNLHVEVVGPTNMLLVLPVPMVHGTNRRRTHLPERALGPVEDMSDSQDPTFQRRKEITSRKLPS